MTSITPTDTDAAATHAADLATLLEAAATNDPDPKHATYDMTTKLHVGEVAPSSPAPNPMDEDDAKKDSPDLRTLKFFDVMSDNGYIVVKPTEEIVAVAMKAAAECQAAARPLEMPKNFSSAAPIPDKGKQEEGDAPRPAPQEHKTHVDVPMTRHGLAADVAAHAVIKQETPMQKVVPGIGYTLDVTGEGQWGYLPTRQERFAVIVPLQPVLMTTVPIPINRAEDDEPGEEYDVIANRCIFQREISAARVPADRGQLEFALSEDTVRAITEYDQNEATIFRQHLLQPGEIVVTTRNHPLRFSCPEGQERAAVHISVPCIDQRPAGDDKNKHRPLDTAHALATGVFRKMRFDAHYPLEPGSCAPDANPFLEEQAGICGIDDVMRGASRREVDGKRCSLTGEQLTDEAPFWSFCLPAARLAGEKLDSERPKNKTHQAIQLYRETAFLSAELDDLLNQCHAVQYIAEGATALTPKQLDKKRRTQSTAENKALGWNKPNNDSLTKQVTELREKLLPKYLKEARDLAEQQAVCATLVARLTAVVQKIDALPAEISTTKKLTDQQQVCLRKQGECESKPTAAKLRDFEKSLSALESYYESALSGGTPGSSARKRKSSNSPTKVPDAETYVPPPQPINTLADALMVRSAMKKTRKELLARIAGLRESNETEKADGLEKLVEQDMLKLFMPLQVYYDQDRQFKAGEGEPVGEVSYDVAPYKFLLQRINHYPDNPLAAKVRQNANKPAITKAKEECVESVEGRLCTNEDFISEPEARRLGVNTTCLKCAAWAKYLEVNPVFLGCEWAIEHDVLFDVRVDDATGMTYFWYNPKKVDSVETHNPSDDVLTKIEAYQTELAEYNEALAVCETEEERLECQEDIMTKMTERRLQRVDIFRSMVNKLHERLHSAMEEVFENPATKKKKASQTWSQFLDRHAKLSSTLVRFDTSVVPEQAMVNEYAHGDDGEDDWDPEVDEDDYEGEEHSSERSMGTGDPCPECGGLFLGGTCADCEYGVDVERPRKLLRAPMDIVAEDEPRAPALSAVRLKLTDFSVEELLRAAISKEPEGPVRENLRSIADSKARASLAHMNTTYRLFVNTQSTTDPVSGAAAWNHNEGRMLEGTEFASKDAAEQYMRTHLNWDPETTGWLFTKPVLKRPAAEIEPEVDEDDEAEASSERSPKRRKASSDEEEDEEDEVDLASSSEQSPKRVKARD
jgi:hypothetical protein